MYSFIKRVRSIHASHSNAPNELDKADSLRKRDATYYISASLSLYVFKTVFLTFDVVVLVTIVRKWVIDRPESTRDSVRETFRVCRRRYLAHSFQPGYNKTHLWGSAKTNFLSFRSRSTMPCSWHAATVSAICLKSLLASCSLSRFLARTYEWRSECDRGKMRYTLFSPTRTSWMGLTCG